jgi:hypothetical protein
MSMRMLLAAVVAVGLLAAAGTGAQAEDKAAVTEFVYACPDCHVVELAAGKCSKCEKDLKKAHLLGVKEGQALLCGCGPGCKCDAKGVKGDQCECGKDIKKASVKGMYVCVNGCPEISKAAGTCACGKELVKAE